MGKPETDLAPRIREKTLELLLEKEPEEISTRDIAKACGVTATSLYYYYKDKEALFTEVKLCCVEKMDKFISRQVTKKTWEYHRRQGKQSRKLNPLDEARIGFEAFRDWAFTNPRIALLVMGRLKADIREDPEKMNKYYQSYFFAKVLLDKAVEAGLSDSKDTLLNVSLCIAALWGAIEAVLLNRTLPQYWTKRGGLDFTNKMIDLLLTSLSSKNRHKHK
ncbi:MAG: TetR/AcrR family transcriptional regulator [Treponema sp.]|nr:TetR/AcrR family transcriptional regulator [Treponema sp.]